MTDDEQLARPQQGHGTTQLTRRKALAAGTGVVAAMGLGGTFAANAVAGERNPAVPEPRDGCYTLTSELVEGPYYIDADKPRRDVTEDQEGIPLHLTLKVIDAETCTSLRNAAVDIWHCNASGVSSGYEGVGGGGGGTPPTGAPTDDTRYLRGTWHTYRHGQVTFKTVFPGWYQGRCVHIHVKVHVGCRRGRSRTRATPPPAPRSTRTRSTRTTGTRAACSTSSTTATTSPAASAPV